MYIYIYIELIEHTHIIYIYMYICNNLPIHHKKGVETISKWVVYDIVLPT